MVTRKFIDYIRYEKRYSPHTVKSYQTDLQQFCNFIESINPDIEIHQSDHNAIRSWIIYLHQKEISNRSINRKISTLKTFYSFLIQSGIITENPTQKVLSPKTSKRNPVFYEEETMDTLLDKVGFENNFKGQRDRLVIELLYNTGIRVSELVGLKHSDIDFARQTIKVLGKRQKERIIPINKYMVRLIEDYCDLKNQNGISFVYLITTKRGKQSYSRMIHRIVNTCLSKVTTISKKSPHILRHTFATHMLNKGADLNAIKELLGHSSLAATQVYTHNSIDKLKSIYKLAHPRA